MKLNLACGNAKIPGWVNVDISPEVFPDVACDLKLTPWPWLEHGIEEIYSSHFLEHLTGKEQIAFMDECYRVLKPGGELRIRCPYYSSMRAWQDPTHERPICERTFSYYSKKEREAMKVGHYNIKSDFDIKELRLHFPEEMQHIPEEERQYLLLHAINTAADIEVLLTKHDPNQQSLDRQANTVVLN